MKPIAFFSNSTIFADDAQDWFVLSPSVAGDDDSLDLGFSTLEQATAQAILDGGRTISSDPSENITFNGQTISDMEDNNYFGSLESADDENAQAEIRVAWTKQMVGRGFFLCNTYNRDDFDANAQSALIAVIEETNGLESAIPISPYTLLDCLREQHLIVIHELVLPQLRQLMSDLGYDEFGEISTTLSNVLSAAEDLVSTGEATYEDETGYLRITPKGAQL